MSAVLVHNSHYSRWETERVGLHSHLEERVSWFSCSSQTAISLILGV